MSMVVLQSTGSKTAPTELASMGSSTGNCECVSDMIFLIIQYSRPTVCCDFLPAKSLLLLQLLKQDIVLRVP